MGGFVNWYTSTALAGVTSAGFTVGTLTVPWCGYIQRARVVQTGSVALQCALRVSTTAAPANFETLYQIALTLLPVDAPVPNVFYAIAMGATQTYWRTLNFGLQSDATALSTLTLQLEIAAPVPFGAQGLSTPGGS